MKIISNIFYGAFIILLLCVAFLFLVPLLPIENNISMRIVESGSMEPKIMTGSLVVITPASHYAVGDVITFKSISSDIPTTHRIVSITEENNGKVFTTKGDANEEADTDVVAENKVLGKVHVSVPYAGFILDFARQPLGFAFLIVLPALMIVLGEIEKIWREIRKNRKGKGGGTSATAREVVVEPEVEVREIVRMIEIGRPIFSYETITRVRHLTVRSLSNNNHRGLAFGEIAISMFVVVSSVCFASLSFVGSTVSYFNDLERSLGNVLEASLLDFTAETDGPAYAFLGADDSVVIETTIAPEDDSMLAEYRVRVEFIDGDIAFCNAIVADAGTPIAYTGPLLDLVADGVVFDPTWDLGLSLDPLITNYLPLDTCVADVIFTAWYAEGYEGDGYSDEEKVRLTLSAPGVSLLRTSNLVEPLVIEGEVIEDEPVVDEEVPVETEPTEALDENSEEQEQPETGENNQAQEIVETIVESPAPELPQEEPEPTVTEVLEVPTE